MVAAHLRRGAWPRVISAGVILASLGVALVARGPALSRRDADAFERKVLEIRQYGTAVQRGSRVTPVSEAELNSFFRYGAGEQMPPGLRQPYVTILGDGRVSGSAIVDLDEVRQASGSDGFGPAALLTGQVEVTAAGRLQAEDGRARFELESAAVGGVPIPKRMLQEVVSYYSRSPEFPTGVNLDDTFELPARISEIHVRPGQAVVVQR